MAPLDQVDHFIVGPSWRSPFSAAAAGEHPRRPRGPVDTPGSTPQTPGRATPGRIPPCPTYRICAGESTRPNSGVFHNSHPAVLLVPRACNASLPEHNFGLISNTAGRPTATRPRYHIEAEARHFPGRKRNLGPGNCSSCLCYLLLFFSFLRKRKAAMLAAMKNERVG